MACQRRSGQAGSVAHHHCQKQDARSVSRVKRHIKPAYSLDSEDMIEPAMHDIDPHEIPDERLKLLFVCAHPAIDEKIRTPLMLQTVLGLEAKQIADAFLIAFCQPWRNVWSAQKLKFAMPAFLLFCPSKAKCHPVSTLYLEAIYGTYSIDWGNADSRQGFGPLKPCFSQTCWWNFCLTTPKFWGLAAHC